jgi:hypothetical protein
MLPEDDRMIETYRNVFKCFNVNFRLLKTVYLHLLLCYLNMGHNVQPRLYQNRQALHRIMKTIRVLG